MPAGNGASRRAMPRVVRRHEDDHDGPADELQASAGVAPRAPEVGQRRGRNPHPAPVARHFLCDEVRPKLRDGGLWNHPSGGPAVLLGCARLTLADAMAPEIGAGRYDRTNRFVMNRDELVEG